MRLWPLVAGLAVGLLAGAIWTWAQPTRYRADAHLLLRPATPALLPAVEALAESSVVESNVEQTLRLSSSPHISAQRGDEGVLTLSAEGSSRERARQIDAETVLVLQQRVQQRFPQLQLTVLDPAHATDQESPTPWRNFLVAGGLGLLAGAAGAAAVRRRDPIAGETIGVDPAVQGRLRARIEEVAKRERALARRAGELAAQEKQLDARQREVAKAAAEPPPPPPPPEPEAEPEPEPQPVAPPPLAAGAGWNIDEIAARVAATEASEATREEWRTYLFFLRGHAASDGTLPPQFDGLVRDVFGDALG
jgi:hypothetical protein